MKMSTINCNKSPTLIYRDFKIVVLLRLFSCCKSYNKKNLMFICNQLTKETASQNVFKCVASVLLSSERYQFFELHSYIISRE